MGPLVAILVIYATLALMAYFLADRAIFQPPASSYSDRDLKVQRVATEDGASIAVLHIVNPSAPLTILYSHGNAEDLGHLAPFLAEMARRGFSVLAYDYRGYGLSDKRFPSASAAFRDIEAVYRHAIDSLHIPPNRLVVYGRSVGSGPSTHLAATTPVGGLILEGGFTSAFRVVTRVPLFPFDRFPNLANLERIHVPMLVIHAMRDEVIPFAHGEQLYAAAREPKQRLWVEGAHHNDLSDVAGESYWAALRAFGKIVESRPLP